MEQWIDLDTADPALLNMIARYIEIEKHGETETIKETHDNWIIRCSLCGETKRIGKQGERSTLSRGRLKKDGNRWLRGCHSWCSPRYPFHISTTIKR